MIRISSRWRPIVTWSKKPPANGHRTASSIILPRDFAVDYTPQLEHALLDLIADMRIDEHRPEVQRSHEDEQRCRHCGFRDNCDQRLA